MRVWLFIWILVFLSGGVFAIGVSPSSHSVSFEPLFSGEFEFNFVFDEGISANLYVDGDLAEYVSLDKEKIRGREKVVASLDLPPKIEIPGTHYIFVGAKQEAKEGSGVGLIADVRGIIRVDVPYPGSYVELDIVALDANVDEKINISLYSTNRGELEINTSPKIQIFDEQTLKKSIEVGEIYLLPGKNNKFETFLNASDFGVGEYSAVAITNYEGNKISRDDDAFRIGEFKVDLVNYTRKISGKGIQPFYVWVESKYSGQIKDFYLDLNLVDVDFTGSSTPRQTLKSFESAKIEGYVDCAVFSEGTFPFEITLHYGNESFREAVYLEYENPKSYSGYIFVGVFLVVVVVVILWFVIHMKKMKV